MFTHTYVTTNHPNISRGFAAVCTKCGVVSGEFSTTRFPEEYAVEHDKNYHPFTSKLGRLISK